MPPIDKDALKRQVDMLKLCVLLGIDVKQVGGQWMALCPFHSEDTPSFSVSVSEGLWHCFGCDRGGDAIKLVQDHKSVSFTEALVFLSEHFAGSNGIDSLIHRNRLMTGSLQM